MIVKHFGCTVIHNKALYKCIIHSFINSFVKDKKNIFSFVTYTIIQSITSSEMCALHLTHPSAHTLGAVDSQYCGARGAVGGSVPCSRVSPQSWSIPARAEIHKSDALSVRPRLPPMFL